MATRKTHRHQKFDVNGNLIEEVVEEEPLEDYHEREYKERADKAIANLTVGVDTTTAHINNWPNYNNAQKLDSVLDLHRGVRLLCKVALAIVRLILRKLDQLDAE